MAATLRSLHFVFTHAAAVIHIHKTYEDCANVCPIDKQLILHLKLFAQTNY